MLAQVIQLNQLEMLHGKHLVDEASCAPRPFSPTHNHAPPHSSLSYNPLATRLLSDISSQKTVIRFHPQFQAMPANDVTTPPPPLASHAAAHRLLLHVLMLMLFAPRSPSLTPS